METPDVISWLLEGDISIQYQTKKDLLGEDDNRLRKRMSSEGWAQKLLAKQNDNGHWGKAFYEPKWTSTHYTLLDLKNLAVHPQNNAITTTLKSIFTYEKGRDGGINPSRILKNSDVCINGMALNYACYFQLPEKSVKSVVDFLLSQKMLDGGFNCQSNRKGAVHSSLHSTISVLEGILEYEANGYHYRSQELMEAKKNAEEFILLHKLFRSDKTGKIIHPNFLKLHHPCRWFYDILRALDYFQKAQAPYDNRMDEALDILKKKRTAAGQWKLAAKYPGKVHMEMEKAGQPSRWNTLRALRVLKKYGDSQTHV